MIIGHSMFGSYATCGHCKTSFEFEDNVIVEIQMRAIDNLAHVYIKPFGIDNTIYIYYKSWSIYIPKQWIFIFNIDSIILKYYNMRIFS